MSAAAALEFTIEELDAFLIDKGHNALLGQRYHAHGDAWVELAMPYDEKIVGDPENGAMARGPILSLLDNTAGVSIWFACGRIRPQVTLDLRADWLRPTERGAALVCRCECVRMTDKIGYVRGFAYEHRPDDPACLVTSAYALL